MTEGSQFSFSKYPFRWAGGEPRVFTVDAEDDFPNGIKIEGTRLITVFYEGGGLGPLFCRIAATAGLPETANFQVLLEYLGDLSELEPLIVYVPHADHLLADIGPALLHITTGWERFARHAGGVHSMYLVLETGPRAKVSAAFHPGGKVDWL